MHWCIPLLVEPQYGNGILLLPHRTVKRNYSTNQWSCGSKTMEHKKQTIMCGNVNTSQIWILNCQFFSLYLCISSWMTRQQSWSGWTWQISVFLTSSIFISFATNFSEGWQMPQNEHVETKISFIVCKMSAFKIETGASSFWTSRTKSDVPTWSGLIVLQTRWGHLHVQEGGGEWDNVQPVNCNNSHHTLACLPPSQVTSSRRT